MKVLLKLSLALAVIMALASLATGRKSDNAPRVADKENGKPIMLAGQGTI